LLVIVGLVTAIFGLLQYFFLPDTRFLENYGWDPHYYRVIGTFLDPGFLGLILVLSLIILVIKIWQKNQDRKKLIGAGLIIYLALALTYSRASYLAYSLTVIAAAWWKRSIKLFLFIFIIGAMTLFLLPRPGGEGVRLERQSTISARILNWQQSIEIVQKNWLFGVGFNAYRYVQDEELKVSHAGAGADSSLLFVLATTGILGLGAYSWLWVKALFLSFKNIKKRENQIALVSILVVLLHSIFANSLFYPWIMAWLWLVLGGIRESKSL
jgi:O-antigen ligase